MKLGRLPRAPEADRVPPLRAAHAPLGPLPPAQPISWTPFLTRPLDPCGNLDVGDCTLAGAAQLTRIATAVAGREIFPTARACVAEYAALSGYNPANPLSDIGLRLTDVLEHWQAIGFDFDGSGKKHRILGYVAVDPTHVDEVGWAIAWCGGLYKGVNVPRFVMDPACEDWDMAGVAPDGLAIEGGHCTATASFLRAGTDTITWAEFKPTTPAFDARFCDECYAVLMEDWRMPDGMTPPGFDAAELEARIRELAASG